MANQVDSLDEQILAALQENGRLTMKSLAEQVGLSSPAMIERVRRLEERGVISGYRAIVAPAALGRPITALISATVDRRDAEGFWNQLQAEEAVSEVHRTTGDATHLIKVNVPGYMPVSQVCIWLTHGPLAVRLVPYTTTLRGRPAARSRRSSDANAGAAATQSAKRQGTKRRQSEREGCHIRRSAPARARPSHTRPVGTSDD